jgi:outer membrane lipoprotein-sorting protein
MRRFLTLLLVGASAFLGAQEQDPKAKAVLDEVSKVTKSYKTLTAEVIFSMLDKDKKQTEKPQSWKILAKGDKFRLEIPGTTIVSDGKTLWNYNKDAREVTIRHFDPESEDQNPSKMFTMYETGYKFKYDKEEKVGAVPVHVIDLYPAIKPEKKRFHTVKLYVDKKKKQVVKMRMIMKDGGTQVYDVKSLKPNTEIADSQFVFDLKGFKPDQINDERN